MSESLPELGGYRRLIILEFDQRDTGPESDPDIDARRHELERQLRPIYTTCEYATLVMDAAEKVSAIKRQINSLTPEMFGNGGAS